MFQLIRDREILSTLAVFALVSIFVLTALITGGFPWLVFWPTFLAASIFIFANPRVGLLAIILLTFIWERFFTLQSLVISGRIVKLYPLDIILIVTTIAFVAHWLIERHHRKLLHDPRARAPELFRTFGSFEKILVLFAVLSTIYFFRSQVVPVREPEIAFSTFKNYAFYMLLTFLTLGLVRTREHYLRFTRTILAGAVGIIAFIVVGVVRGEGLWTEFTPLSTEGVRYLAFPHAWYLTIALLIAMSLFVHRLFRWPWVALLIMGVEFVGFLGSLMRHLWIAFLVGGVALIATGGATMRRYVIRWGQVVLVVVLILLIVGGVTLLFFPESGLGNIAARFLDPLIARVASFGRVSEDLSALWRLKLWETTFTRFAESPFFGIGFGQEITFDLRGYVSTIRLRDLHNSFFGVLVQTGLLGFTLFVAAQVVLIVSYLRRRGHLGGFRPFADGIFAAYIAFLVAANFQPYLETNILSVPFWVLLGLLRAAPYLSEKPSIDWSHLKFRRHLQILESTHHRGLTVVRPL